MSLLKQLQDKSTAYHILVFGLIALFSFILFTIIGLVVSIGLFDFNFFSNPFILNQTDNPEVVNALRMIQFFNALGLFVVPPIVYAKLLGYNVQSFFRLDQSSSANSIGLIIGIMVVALPFINWTAMLNEGMHLPNAFGGIEQWMRDSEENAKVLTESLLKMDSFGLLLSNMIVIAILPAIGEELFFRGTLQQLIQRSSKNPHIAIWVTAFLFSALHMQFLGFIPRMLLGALFGYLFYWSGNLWLPIIGHFVNNGFAVMATYMIQQNKIGDQIETVGALEGQTTLALGSGLIVCGMLYTFYKQSLKEPLGEK